MKTDRPSRPARRARRLVRIAALVALAGIGFMGAREVWHPAVAGRQVGMPVAAPAASAPTRQVASPRERVVVAFRLDQDLTRGIYLGDRWVSPPSYLFAQQGDRYVVQAKAQRVDKRGERVDLSSDWAVSDPEMVAVTRRPGGEVTIVVRQPGESRVTVSTGAGSILLHVRATRLDDAMQVEFTQSG